MCVTSESGLVWSMNCESWLEPKNSLITAETGLELIRSCGISVSISWRRHALLDRALHADQTDAVLVLEQLADRAHAAVAEVVDVVDRWPGLPFLRSTRYFTAARMSSRASRRGVLGLERLSVAARRACG